MAAVATNVLILDAMTALTLATHKLNGSKIVLYAANLAVGKETTVAELEVITAAGLDAKTAITWSLPFLGADGRYYVAASIGPFIATDADDLPVTINGWAVLDTAGTGCLGGEKFDGTRAITAVGQGVEVNPLLAWGS